MKKLIVPFFLILLSNLNIMAQTSPTDLPYYQIPDYPEGYTAENVVARMLDGLGFRYYWATEGLRPEDLVYKPSEEARTSEETLDHIYGLVQVTLNAVNHVSNENREYGENLSFEEKRRKTLETIEAASKKLKSGEVKLEDCKIIFAKEYPFWNNINGPIADALWHVGQVVSFRRASGNPFNSKVSVFNGKLRN